MQAHPIGAGIKLDSLRLVAEVWLRRLSGVLVVPSDDAQSPRRLLFVDGALAEAVALAYLNSALYRSNLLFAVTDVEGVSDRSALGALLMTKARSLVRREPLNRLADELESRLDADDVDDLGVWADADLTRMLRTSQPFASPDLARSPSATQAVSELKALILLGFLSAVDQPRTPPVEAVAPAPVAARGAPSGAKLERCTSVLDAVLVEMGAVGWCAELMDEDDDDIDAMLAPVREQMMLQDWRTAWGLLRAAHDLRFDHARILAYLAVFSLALVEDVAEGQERARRYAEAAVALDPSDTIVLRLVQHVEANILAALANARA